MEFTFFLTTLRVKFYERASVTFFKVRSRIVNNVVIVYILNFILNNKNMQNYKRSSFIFCARALEYRGAFDKIELFALGFVCKENLLRNTFPISHEYALAAVHVLKHLKFHWHFVRATFL